MEKKEEKIMRGKKITPPVPFFLRIRITPNSYPNREEYNSPPNYIHGHSMEIIKAS